MLTIFLWFLGFVALGFGLLLLLEKFDATDKYPWDNQDNYNDPFDDDYYDDDPLDPDAADLDPVGYDPNDPYDENRPI